MKVFHNFKVGQTELIKNNIRRSSQKERFYSLTESIIAEDSH